MCYLQVFIFNHQTFLNTHFYFLTWHHLCLFHDTKKISNVQLCDNSTTFKVCAYMRIFPVAESVDLLFGYNKNPYNKNRCQPLSNLCCVQIAYEGQLSHIRYTLAHVARFYGWLRLIRSVWRASKLSVFKIDWIGIFGWSDNSKPTHVVNLRFKGPTFPLCAMVAQSNGQT